MCLYYYNDYYGYFFFDDCYWCIRWKICQEYRSIFIFILNKCFATLGRVESFRIHQHLKKKKKTKTKLYYCGRGLVEKNLLN